MIQLYFKKVVGTRGGDFACAGIKAEIGLFGKIQQPRVERAAPDCVPAHLRLRAVAIEYAHLEIRVISYCRKHEHHPVGADSPAPVAEPYCVVLDHGRIIGPDLVCDDEVVAKAVHFEKMKVGTHCCVLVIKRRVGSLCTWRIGVPCATVVPDSVPENVHDIPLLE